MKDAVSIRFKVRGASRRSVNDHPGAGDEVSIRFKVRGASRLAAGVISVVFSEVSIRFKVRGASRQARLKKAHKGYAVSIRFKVRGASRQWKGLLHVGVADQFQSALRFAVLPDSRVRKWVSDHPISLNPV